jgi:hypothetical protein
MNTCTNTPKMELLQIVQYVFIKQNQLSAQEIKNTFDPYRTSFELKLFVSWQ